MAGYPQTGYPQTGYPQTGSVPPPGGMVPQPAPDAGRGGGRSCYNCGQVGHEVRDCPHPRTGNCYRCGQPGHKSTTCTNPPLDRSGRDGGAGAGFGNRGGYDSRGAGGFGPGPVGGGGMGMGMAAGAPYVEPETCTFYMRIGACRHLSRCARLHPKVNTSATVMLPMMYPNPKVVPLQTFDAAGNPVPLEYEKEWLKKHQTRFYEDVYLTIMEIARIIEMRVMDNVCDHLVGNVFVKFESPMAAQRVVEALTGKMYHGVLLMPEVVPVSDFLDAMCKDNDRCNRRNECGFTCNYWHQTTYPRYGGSVIKDLEKEQAEFWAKKKRDEYSSGSSSDYSSRSSSGSRDSDGAPSGRSAARPPAPSGPLCHICGKTGHISNDCKLRDV